MPDAWRRHYAMEAELTRAITDRMIALAALAPDARVLDVGCGTGEPAIPMASAIAPRGTVLGIDPSEGMLAVARERAAMRGVSNVRFAAEDAQTFDAPSASFDAATARWSLMYLADPAAAMTRVHRALVPDGRFVAAVWGAPDEVDFAGLWRRALAPFGSVPPIDPEAPGVCRFGAPDALPGALEAAGFVVETVEAHATAVVEVDRGEDFVAWVLAFGGHVRDLVDALTDEDQRAFADALAAEAERHRRGDTIRIGGITRIVVARASTLGRRA